MIYILVKLLINPFKHYKSNCIKTYVKFQANQMKFEEFMESQFEPTYTGNRIQSNGGYQLS